MNDADTRYNRPMRVPRGLAAAVIVLVACGCLWSAVHRDPWDPDETRYLEVTHELLASGNPFFLRFNGEAYTDKPPLFFWLLAPLAAVFGADRVLPGTILSLLCWLALGLATARLGSAAGLDPCAARWGPLLTMSALMPALLSGGCRMDMLFAVWCTLALERLIRLANPSADGSNRSHLLLWLWIALAVLTKGPLVLALLAGALVVAGRGSRSILRRAVVGWGPLLAILIISVWLVPAALIGGRSWLDTIVVHQSAGRVVASFAHREPWWYHLATVPLTLMPWSPLILLGTLRILAQRHAQPAQTRVLAAFPLAGILLLSLLSGKTFLYPLPLFPAACLVAAWWLNNSPESVPQRLTVACGAALPLLLGVGIAIALAPRPEMELGTRGTLLAAGSLLLPSLAAMVFLLKHRMAPAMTMLVLAVPLFVAIGLQPIVGPFNRLLSLRPFAAAYAGSGPPTAAPGVAYGKLQPGFVLFTGRQFHVLESADELEQALGAGRRVAIDLREARRLRLRRHLGYRELARVPYRHSAVLVIESARDGL
jgi:4-amino-4-deoxy-L-arabinose transferase-like glycosyltransferase